MKRHILSVFTALMVLLGAISCEQKAKEDNLINKKKMDSTDSLPIKPHESGYADVNGLKMYYEVYGEGKPLIMVHGSFMTIPMNWAQIIPMLAKDRKVIVAEMQAHGRTKDIPRAFTYANMADDVSGLITHLKLDSVDVLGYSMGAGVSFQMTIRHPEQVRRLVILSGVYKNDGWWPEVEKSFETMNADMFKGSPIQQQYDSLGNDPAKFPEFIDKVMSIDRKTYDWSKEVKNIKAPIFMAIGDADGVRYEHALELFRAKGGGKMGDMNGLPKSRLAILPGTTHIGMITQPDIVIPMITSFLDSDLNTAPPTF
ncbi:alpha/beta fold hydrolase [Dyadobacter fanqingshengii]|uniref:Alpha/beta hydrolase n=1 Tax=Dyadobacter fanqingshengii TaxID=2906443 RepID=A0A9X1T976_9BACT|nr:alpha/beta hydrolase [Dyadobacter fanqingshengii]MCF0040416.1 alpha/beta hydrolase [Dyadobacter fanqingshengii]USJ37842.1 alpha/beta hydrolase [Dyadobacter fanqingshengii]